MIPPPPPGCSRSPRQLQPHARQPTVSRSRPTPGSRTAAHSSTPPCAPRCAPAEPPSARGCPAGAVDPRRPYRIGLRRSPSQARRRDWPRSPRPPGPSPALPHPARRAPRPGHGHCAPLRAAPRRSARSGLGAAGEGRAGGATATPHRAAAGCERRLRRQRPLRAPQPGSGRC